MTVSRTLSKSNSVSFRLPEKALEKLESIRGKRTLSATCQDLILELLELNELPEKPKDFKETLEEILEEKLNRKISPQLARINADIAQLKKEDNSIRLYASNLYNMINMRAPAPPISEELRLMYKIPEGPIFDDFSETTDSADITADTKEKETIIENTVDTADITADNGKTTPSKPKRKRKTKAEIEAEKTKELI